MKTTHRDHRLYLRVATPLFEELEAGAAERRQGLAVFVREILLDWHADRFADRAAKEAA
jgi:hypothetical protein